MIGYTHDRYLISAVVCSFLSSLTTNHDATSQALSSQKEAEKNLQAHFENIQRISDGTTLPQMLLELERGLERAASVDLILGELRLVPVTVIVRKGQNSGSSHVRVFAVVVWRTLLTAMIPSLSLGHKTKP